MSTKGPYLHIPRRRFLIGAGAAALIVPFARNTALAEPGSSPLFTLGVASGDPDANSVVLWTRIAPDPLALDGGNAADSIDITWRVATDPLDAPACGYGDNSGARPYTAITFGLWQTDYLPMQRCTTVLTHWEKVVPSVARGLFRRSTPTPGK